MYNLIVTLAIKTIIGVFNHLFLRQPVDRQFENFLVLYFYFNIHHPKLNKMGEPEAKRAKTDELAAAAANSTGVEKPVSILVLVYIVKI
jgi:hypothetical protein